MPSPVEIIESSRATHVAWIEWLAEYPEFNTDDVGDFAHHLLCVRNYDKVLEVLNAVA